MTEPESNKVKHLFVHIMQTYQFTGNATYNSLPAPPPERRGFGGTQKAVKSGVYAQCLPNNGCFKLDRS